MSLQTVESVDTLETEDGEFVLKKVLAGEHKGMREIGLMDNYMNFSEVLDALNLSVRLNNGILHIDGRGKKRTVYVNEPEPMGTLHYREERVLKIGLKDQNRNDLDCLLIRDALYISMKDVETGNLLGEKGITYDDYKWYPIRSSEEQ